MIYNLNEIHNDPFKDKQFDVCIIGAGIAGITLAMYLKKSINILLIEGGGIDYSQESQDIYKGKNIGHEYFNLDEPRARWLGGSSNVWGGWSASLGTSDFEKRDFIKYSGWPINKTDLDPYEKEARSIVDLPDKRQLINYQGWTDILENSDKNLNGFEFKWSFPPTNFRDKYKSQLENQSNITCLVNANLTDMTLTDNLSSIKSIEVKNYKNNVFNTKSKIYILATGGIENPRLLLNFNKQCKDGIGNDYGLVGRFFSEHPHFVIGDFIMDDHIVKIFSSNEEEKNHEFRMNFLVPSEKFQKHDHVLNFGLRVETNLYPYKSKIRPFKEKLKRAICSTDLSESVYDALLGKQINCKSDGIIRIAAEQAPNPDSTVTLGPEFDKLGLKRTVLNWQLLPIDKHTFTKASISFAKMFAEQNLGRVKIDDWIRTENTGFPGFPQELGGAHHMGTTRMGSSSSEGVVDKNQKVFGIDNLYIAGSSVFTTTGHVNPTFPIIQMTLRLAEHINSKNTKV